MSSELPVLIIHQSGHLAVLNSKALEVAGYTAETDDPEGGVIQRREGSKEPNGVLEEVAFFGTLPKLLANIGEEGAKAFVRAGAELWARFGYTTAQEGRAAPATAQLIKKVADEGGIKIDVAVYSDVLVDRDYIKANVSSDYSNRFRLVGAKLTIDGSPQGFTALRDRPYYNPVGDYPPGYAGYASASMDQVLDAVNWAFENDIQIITHANGEGASDRLIAAIGAATQKYGKADRRPVLIHGQLLREDQVDALQRVAEPLVVDVVVVAGVVVVVDPPGGSVVVVVVASAGAVVVAAPASVVCGAVVSGADVEATTEVLVVDGVSAAVSPPHRLGDQPQRRGGQIRSDQAIQPFLDAGDIGRGLLGRQVADAEQPAVGVQADQQVQGPGVTRRPR